MFKSWVILLLLPAFVPAIASRAWADGSRLTAGDIIMVNVEGEKDFTKQYQIDSDGCVRMAMISPVKVAEMSASDAAAAITTGLLNVMVNPQVSVSFVERAKMQVFVVGQVKTPGLVSVGVGDKVVQALAQSGYDDTADLAHVSVRRGDQVMNLDLTKYLNGQDLNVNIGLQSGDTVVVPALDAGGTVMILGQTAKTGKIPLKPGMTFREAMGFIGGIALDADTDKITIKREGFADPIKVDYALAMAGDPSADLALQPGDTVYVPQFENAYFTVMGGVARPGPYPLKGKITLSEAVGMAGGAAPDRGDLGKVSITQASASGKPGAITKVDLKKIIAGAGEDPVVHRGDLIYVGEKKRSTSFLQVLQILLPLGWLLR